MSYHKKKADVIEPQPVKSNHKQWQSVKSRSLNKSTAQSDHLVKLYENLPCIWFTLNSAGVVLALSEFGAAYLGYEAAELTQKSVSEVIYWEDQISCQAKLTDLQQLPTQISQWEARIVCKNGNILWVKVIAKCCCDSDVTHSVLGRRDAIAHKQSAVQEPRQLNRLEPGTASDSIILLVCEDITAFQQRSETRQEPKELEETEESFRVTFEQAAVGISHNDLEGRFSRVNQKFCEIVGYTQDELLTRTFRDITFPDDIRVNLDYVRSLLAGEIENYSMEKRYIRKDGSLVWGHQTVSVVRESTGKPKHFVAVVEDISERKQAEEALRQQLLREQLVGGISQRIHRSLNLEEILNTTVAEVRQFLACDRVIIFRINSDGSGVVVVESVDSDWTPITGTIINDRYFAESYIQLYEQGRVQAVTDVYTSGLTQCHIDLLTRFQVRANLVVPIVHEEKKLWGLLVAQQCGEARQWQSLEIDLLKSLSTQAAIAIQQSELYHQAQTEITQRQQAEAALQQQFQRERLIGAIAQRIRKSLNLEKILERTVAEVRQVLNCDRVIIFRFDPDWSGKVVVESVNKPSLSILGTDIYDPCFEEAYIQPYRQGRVKAMEDIYTANLGKCHFDLLTQYQVRANLVVPILKREQLWGLLIAHHCSSPRQWPQFEIDLLTSLASQVAIAIQQSQLYEQAQSQALREQAINQVTQAIRSSLDLNTIFSTAVHKIGELLHVDRAEIVQYLPERKLWLHVSEYRKSHDFPVFLGQEIPDENNPIAERLKRLEIVQIQDTETLEDGTQKDMAQGRPGAWLLVPLQFGSKVLGSLTLGRYIRPYHWQELEVELIRAVADQVAIAIHQAELYEQSRTATATALTQAQQLEQTLQELQKTQTHLVQSEKMSSLGQLVAGVAHEINNPVNFIYGNLIHASGYTQDLLSLVKLYQQQYPNPTPEIQSEIEAADLDFLIEDLPKLLDSMRVGAERICEIVSSLRTFSRLAEAEMKAVDIHEGLDSTLTIVQHRLRAQGKHPEIQVIKQYGNLPKVECYPGQLNQVFMNLLTNAIDALEELNVGRLNVEGCLANLQPATQPNLQPATPCIRISTEVLNNHQVVIRIADNGPGMTEQVKARLFDPFFTTKPVGAGTGLGLSISYQIVVEKHSGQLYCFSQVGQGTEFVIQIPLWQRTKE